MDTTKLFKGVMSKIMMGASLVLMTTSAYGTSQVDPMVQEARLKAADGDLEAAVVLYHEAMKKDSENPQIRGELAQIIVKAQVREPHAEVEPEVIEVIEKGTKSSVD